MIKNERELEATQNRIATLQAQVAHLRVVEQNAANYHASASGYLAEIDKMQLAVREFLTLHPSEAA